MRRRFRGLMIAFSLVVCLVALGLGARSWLVTDMLERHRRGDRHGLGYDEIHGALSSQGAIGVGYVRIDHPGVAGFQEKWVFESTGPPGFWPMRWHVLGVGYWNVTFRASPQRGVVNAVGFQVPHLLVAALAGIPPGLWGRRWWIGHRKRRRIAAGLCGECGYDLRSSGERCSECGSAERRIEEDATDAKDASEAQDAKTSPLPPASI